MKPLIVGFSYLWYNYIINIYKNHTNLIRFRMLDYYSKNKTFFLDYLPDEFFINLNDRQRINYRIVRENHAEYAKIKEEISDLDFEIKQIKQK
ncbi:MAG: hypothetical protein CM15mP65_12860 [Crocinitomicaceae bacterium]|nr:MAG: hypothetical protein CM15mP65_12860 [Crocinitomicaceae bacterium]